ncbi:hypothetical protein HPB52_016812 [Rhipicephalus sanguineus]|uniref:Uncharacterized protein n=1 Tax=Rhipicephalus sanguineus TaxID=34632 RepID=A0A9D4PMI4_RHISA|nr:hypothetical protein HPB52_016812 [Rhipicephalus sanguineus]
MFVFPPPGEFDTNCIRLVLRSCDPETAVACLLGFIKMVRGSDFQKVLNSADKDGVWLEQVRVTTVEMRQQLHDLMPDSEPTVTMDDLHVVLGMLLCSLSCTQGSDMNHGWLQVMS